MINLFRKKNEIFHMASMARSGETLMLKILAVHPNVKVVHNLDKEDDIDKDNAFKFLKSYKKQSIRRSHPLFSNYNLKKNDILLLKQGVWKHSFPFKGFVLSRNPVSIYSSLKTYDRLVSGYNKDDNYWFENSKRLKRWLKDIDSSKINEISDKSPIEQFVSFYNIRMGDLALLGLPIIRYEDLILKTRETLDLTCRYLGIEMDERMLNSHKYYKKGIVGHGQNDLSKPIDSTSLNKFKKNITNEEFNFIKEKTYSIYNQFGYKLESGEIYY